ncbi:PKS-like enzyme [Aspergillus costaricaensis CBS 115574]|uniref:PKS-like enzyme n=1 Tax=Aspergillus costaricaensis CBS 115574 TaxID=1448317 RepID=A0ACD1IGC0_9EURO|nr:PKS-like enzyme [Aspergillus costaricaensis CBS 115574]RAK89610.1 PKS-like enzyme [Aspergillus costaricaensis CBS 115574]
MTTEPLPTSLSQALDLPFSSARQCSVQLPSDIAVGSVSVGGYVACLMTKYALYYATQHPKLQSQIALRSSYVQFYRPTFASAPLIMTLREVNIGKAHSTLRVESFQNEKLAVSVDIAITNLSITGITIQTDWRLFTPPTPVDLTKLERDSDPNWISYHCAFYPEGFRRGQSYLKNFIPRALPTDFPFIEQWVEPGWDYLPLGSRPSESGGKARWTNDMVQFVGDMPLPIQENYVRHEEGKPFPMGSIAAMLEFAKRQEKARNEGRSDWRVLNDDGTKKFSGKLLNVSLTLSTEIKQRLPAEGVRWLYLRTECKRILNGQMDMEVLIFDERMDLIAISQQVAALVPANSKIQKL